MNLTSAKKMNIDSRNIKVKNSHIKSTRNIIFIYLVILEGKFCKLCQCKV